MTAREAHIDREPIGLARGPAVTEEKVMAKSRAEYQRTRRARMLQATCHPDRKEHCGGWCRSCYNHKGRRALRATCHPERLHVAKGLCQRCYNELPENKARDIHRRRVHKYKLTEEQYTSILSRQGWRCAICRSVPDSVDHDHKTNKVRGVLCRLCNTGIGHFRDSPAFLRTAALYLEAAR